MAVTNLANSKANSRIFSEALGRPMETFVLQMLCADTVTLRAERKKFSSHDAFILEDKSHFSIDKQKSINFFLGKWRGHTDVIQIKTKPTTVLFSLKSCENGMAGGYHKEKEALHCFEFSSFFFHL